MKPLIRVAVTIDGEIEAVPEGDYHCRFRVVVDRRTGKIISATVPRDSELFRHLAGAARQHLSRPDRRECM